MLAVEEATTVGDRLGSSSIGRPESGDRPGLVYRELSIDEWNLLSTCPPFDKKATPSPQAARVIVAQDSTTGELVAYWFVFTAVHVEPVWIAEKHRHRPSVVRNLWASVKRLLRTIDCNLAFCCVNYDAPWMNAAMAQRLGFRRLPTDLFFLDLTKLNAGGQE